ncbi:MAG: transposase [Treponema sp.]|nr:transposase [Treponema sp.]
MEQKERRFVGIDLGKTKYTVKVILSNGKVIGWEGKTTPAGRNDLYRQLLPTDRVGIEVCSLAMKMAREMSEKVGCDIALMDAHQLAVIYNSVKKNDKEDALKLARLVQKNSNEELPVVSLPSEQETKRRNLLTENKELKQSRTQEINRLHAIFLRCGHTEVVKKNLASKENREEIS